jgi:hypothetical protein
MNEDDLKRLLYMYMANEYPELREDVMPILKAAIGDGDMPVEHLEPEEQNRFQRLMTNAQETP